MNKFSYKFSIKIYILMAIGTLIAVACLVMNIVRLVKLIMTDNATAYNLISISVALLMSVAFLILIITLLADSAYVLTDKAIIVKFGLIKSTYEFKSIKQLVWFKENNKLTFFHDDESFTNVVIAENEYELFAQTLTERAPNIVYYVDINDEKK